MLTATRAPSRAPLLVLALALAGCGSTTSATPPPQAADEPTASPTASAEPTATASPSAEAGPIEHQLTGAVPLTITTPADWEIDPRATAATPGFQIGPDRWVIFTTVGPNTVEEWLERFEADAYVTTEPEPVEIGGAPGFTLDLRLAEGIDEVLLINEGTAAWAAEADRPHRIWVLDVSGEPIVILTDAPERAFESWTAVVEDALATLEWGE